jgi:hypothetical protein
MAQQTKPVDELVLWAAWELKRYRAEKGPVQRSIRAKLVNTLSDLEEKKAKKYAALNTMYDYMSAPEKWDVLDGLTQDDRWEQFHRTLKEYEFVCDCVAGIEAL